MQVFRKHKLLIDSLMFELDPEKPVTMLLWPASSAPAGRIFSHASTALFRGDHLFSAKSTGEASTGEEVWQSTRVALSPDR